MRFRKNFQRLKLRFLNSEPPIDLLQIFWDFGRVGSAF
ncbi:hypothetical protein LEP1GSC133_0687 [Leptospira borgpetersenii serovar Pomona str. 200901868]|uniref:Uncharacterized protein n=1 Tax=Leptospira borgpetersenii serovar Pomona str. 200901868 TaxID=1192866 RepID=M6WHK2_LEPBO|nr:hypothetical protein LEP1GSC133_0687 [Leptospira borgpetersenii serovar Pomona str. 200901868]